MIPSRPRPSFRLCVCRLQTSSAHSARMDEDNETLRKIVEQKAMQFRVMLIQLPCSPSGACFCQLHPASRTVGGSLVSLLVV